MTRYLVTLHTEKDRKRAMKIVSAAPNGARVEIKASKRSLPQNSRFWASLSDVALQYEHNGRKHTPEEWRTLFMSAWRNEDTDLVSGLNGEVVDLRRSSDLSKGEMSDLIDFVHAWGAENGVRFHDGA